MYFFLDTNIDYGVPCGPGFTLIRLQALGAGPVSVSIPNAKIPHRDRYHSPSADKLRAKRKQKKRKGPAKKRAGRMAGMTV